MSSGVVEAFAVFTSALTELRKSFDQLYQVHEPDLVELIRAHHSAVAQLQYLGLDLLTEARQRSIPDRGRHLTEQLAGRAAVALPG
jgi:hypothetical protein